MGNIITPPQSDKIVVKSNQFINGFFFNKDIKGVSERVSSTELKLLAAVLAKINPTSPEISEITVSLDEFNELMESEYHPARFKEVVDLLSILRYNALLPDTENRKNLTGSFAVFRYAGLAIEGETLVAVFRIEEAISPFLYKLASNYTKLKLKDYFCLSSATYIRLFEILSQYKYRGRVTIDYSELRKMLNIEEEKYPTFSNFRRRVLDPAKEAIIKHTGLIFSYTTKRAGKGGKADAITFTFNTPKSNVYSIPQEKLSLLTDDDDIPDQNWDREEICAGFSDPVFNEFTNEQLEYLKNIAWTKISEKDVEFHQSIVGNKAREWAVSQFIEKKLKYIGTKQVNNKFAYLCKVISASQ